MRRAAAVVAGPWAGSSVTEWQAWALVVAVLCVGGGTALRLFGGVVVLLAFACDVRERQALTRREDGR